MIHLGDIQKLDGHKLPIVDIITGGSPCQNLSIAGNRKGLEGEQSSLFLEQIRIIKEMREECERTNDVLRPRYMVWENVTGAFSSNKGEDFRRVLEETARIADKAAVIPRFEGGLWSTSGCILGNRWSIAWRVHDAQFWGVPQRRKRIALVADFAGESAPEILFERKSVSGNIAESGTAGQGIAPNAERSVDKTICYGISAYESNAMKSSNPHAGIYEADTSRTLDCNGGNPACNQGGMAVVCLEGNGSRPSHQGNGYSEGETMYTLNSTEHHAVCIENHPADSRVKVSEDGIVQTLSSRTGTGDHNDRITDYTAVVFRRQRSDQFSEDDVTCTQNARQHKDATDLIKDKYGLVRRLTPLEVERLQGYPDGYTDIGDWTDSKGKAHKGDADRPRYKALGNSIALPFWQWLAGRINKQFDRQPTMASLFNGIGGFPLVFLRTGAKPVWASEIDDFCIAVSTRRIAEQEKTQKIIYDTR